VWKRLSNALFLAGIFVIASDVVAQSLPNHPEYDDIINRGFIDVAVYADFPPFSSRVDGELSGVDVDLARLIAGRLGIHATFRELQADETVADDLRNAIWKGHYLGGGISDLMMHVPVDREFARRNPMVVINGPYYQERLVLARDPEKTGDTPSLAVYRYEKVGVELDTLPDFFLSGFQGGMLAGNVVHYPTVGEAAAGLLRGEVAAVFAPRSQIETALAGNESRFVIEPALAPGLVRDRWNLGVAVSAHTRQLGYAVEDILTELVDSGAVSEVFDQYGLSYTEPE
jgi:ABC-type amino acid transport substrate-binding protein